MATNNGTPATAHPLLVSIDTLAASAKDLYRAARRAGTEFSEVENVVRGLYTRLKHLKVEAEDPDSLLNSDHTSPYAEKLTSIVKKCDYGLELLDTVLDKVGGNSSYSEEEGRDGDTGNKPLETEERDMVDLIRTILANQKLNIDELLDTVQLQNPSKSHQILDTNNANLESIKDKVDAIAARITQRNDSISSEGDDELWLQFRNELEKEGFSRDVLRKNQDILRAYIRQLDEHSMGGKTPTVRGFLEGYPPSDHTSSVVPYPVYPEAANGFSPKEMHPSTHNEKFPPGMKLERMRPEQHPPYPSSLPTQSTAISYDPRSSDDGDVDDDDSSDNSLALVISTRDLMALDKREADLAIAMGNMHLQNPALPYPGSHYAHDPNIASSPQGRYLPPPANAGLLPSPTLDVVDQFGLSPRFLPPVPPPPYGSSPPPTLHHNSISAPVITGGAPPAPGGQSPQRYARLAPDSLGRDIPLDAHWTRIKRSLISPEVLNQAGVRYEARPDFVAILGVFTKEDLTEFARRSAEVRRRRADQQGRDHRSEKDRYHPEKYKNWDVEAQQKNGNARHRANSEFSSSSDLYDSSDEDSDEELPSYRPRGASNPYPDEKSESYDEDDKGTKIYPFIVSPPDTDKEGGPSPSATVKPKPILKNKNDDPHVRFDTAPQVLNGASPRSVPRHSERSRDEKRPRERSDRDRYIPRSHDDRDNRDREKDRDRDRDDEHRRHSRHHSDSGRRRERDRDDNGRRRRRDDRDRDRHRGRDDADKSEDRSTKKKARGETLRAVGIGGAAASLLSVLTEAAAGL